MQNERSGADGILGELDARGLIQDVSARDELAKKFASEVVGFYIGYDPTGTSLHIGNLQQIILQVRLQRAGHQPFVLVGGATGMIGDPSGRKGRRCRADCARCPAPRGRRSCR